MTIKRAFSIIASAALLFLPVQEVFSQGLGFHGMDYRIDQRTSYDVFGSSPETFSGSISIDFELYTEPISEFGYFFRMKDEGGSHRIWNLSYDSRGDSTVVRLNEEGRQSLIKAIIPHDDVKHLHWHDVHIGFDLVRDSVKLDIAGRSFSAHFPGLPDKIKAAVIFGKSDHIIDVPSFAIRKLHIGNARKGFDFPLDSTEGSLVCDTAFKVLGRTENPEWLINNAMHWKECGNFSYEDIAAAGYNPHRKEFYYFTNKEMTVLDLMKDQTRTLASHCPVRMKLGNNFVPGDGKEIFCYELYNDEVPAGSASTALFDIEEGKWERLSTQQLSKPLHHHTGFTNPATGRYVIFGGFGDMSYNGEFHEFDSETCEWNEIYQNHGGDRIYPRYFTSSGTDGKYIYIYGGMGNECGEQVVGRRYFYDLHRIDPKTGFCEKLWELDWDEGDKVPVRSLIIDGDCFYTLCYPEYMSQSHLSLYRFCIADGTKTVLCNDIPIASDKMRTNANLYLDKELGLFFATVQEFPDDIKSTLKIYSLAYPPVTEARGLSDGEKLFRVFARRWWWAAAIAFSALLALAISLILKKRKGADESLQNINRRIFKTEAKADSISLFGDLTVLDHDGEDITPLFTNQQILILCLLIKRRENGISTKHLSSVLWPDKEEEKVKNSRGVAINNLRKSLGHLQGAIITFREGRYYLELSGECTCDLFRLLDSLKGGNKDEALGIISRGKFLKSVNDDIFDDFKEKIDNIVFPLLQDEIEHRFKVKDYEAVYEIREMISRIDPVDEASFLVTVRALKRQKRIEEALVLYSTFCNNYKKLNDTDFSTPFKGI